MFGQEVSFPDVDADDGQQLELRETLPKCSFQARAERGLLTKIPYQAPKMYILGTFLTTVPKTAQKTVRSSKNTAKITNLLGGDPI